MSDERPLICGFLKVRNEIIREGNIYRVLANMEHYCDAAVVCDDASSDGTREHLIKWARQRGGQVIQNGTFALVEGEPRWTVLLVPPGEQDFRKELLWKQAMLQFVHAIKPRWVLWMDGDEVFDASGTAELREWIQTFVEPRVERAWRFHYTQFWRNTAWARTDAGFDDGYFLKLWRYQDDLTFDVIDGTHHHQFPRQVLEAFHMGLVGTAPFEQLHYGNYGKNLTWKCIQYWGGLGGVDRHLVFPQATYRPVDPETIPKECERSMSSTSLVFPPKPFTDREVDCIREMRNLKGLAGWFTVVVPTYNRADTLARALDSLIGQTYESWVALVLDDGSTDATPALLREYQDKDPRIFYCRYPINRGGVVMNEIGMTLASEMTEYWSRLGSDDWLGANKLAYDAAALSQFEAVYGAYVVSRNGQLAEVCNPPRPPQVNRQALLTSGFVASWANCAVRTSVLRSIRKKYGNFCDPGLRNMEDFLVNARVARETIGWVWRGLMRGQLVINPHSELIAEMIGPNGLGVTEVEAVWTAVESGASGNVMQTMKDENLTRSLIMRENIQYGLG